jgi:AAA+ ATPase superfamily predicted ATPase
MIITLRIAEQKVVALRLSTKEPELIAIYGRRRVGKTYL